MDTQTHHWREVVISPKKSADLLRNSLYWCPVFHSGLGEASRPVGMP